MNRIQHSRRVHPRREKLTGMLQNLYPQHLASAVMHRATRIRFVPYKNWQVSWFVRKYGVDMHHAVEPDPRAYANFNAFFTRELQPHARPVSGNANDVVSPADGEISQYGRIRDGRLMQAKGIYFGLEQLLAGKSQLAEMFDGGDFVTIYLSPRDYHRVHMPFDGRLRQMIHVPGRLFSVNHATARVIKGLFARNERVINLFETAIGPMALILVGAVFVGSIETVWAGPVTPRRGRTVTAWQSGEDGLAAPRILKGEEMGRFNMGSTVIALFPPECLRFVAELDAGQPVRMGETIARLD